MEKLPCVYCGLPITFAYVDPSTELWCSACALIIEPSAECDAPKCARRGEK